MPRPVTPEDTVSHRHLGRRRGPHRRRMRIEQPDEARLQHDDDGEEVEQHRLDHRRAAAASATTTTSGQGGRGDPRPPPSPPRRPETTKRETRKRGRSISEDSLGGSNDFVTPAASLTGAGSTFDQPLFARQFYDYNKANSKVTVDFRVGRVRVPVNPTSWPAASTSGPPTYPSRPAPPAPVAPSSRSRGPGRHCHGLQRAVPRPAQLTGSDIARSSPARSPTGTPSTPAAPPAPNIGSRAPGRRERHDHLHPTWPRWPRHLRGRTSTEASTGWVGGSGGNGNAGVAGDVAEHPRGPSATSSWPTPCSQGLNYAAVQNSGQYMVHERGSVAGEAAECHNVLAPPTT